MSAASTLTLRDGSEVPVGFYLPELAIPGMALEKAGVSLVFASPGGAIPKMDESSNSSKFFSSTDEWHQALQWIRSHSSLQNPAKLSALSDAELARFAAVFIPGGHAPMQDLYKDKDLGRILVALHSRNAIISAICHGPVALVSANLSATPWPFQGYKMSVFSNPEDMIVELLTFHGKLRFLPSSLLSEMGAQIHNGIPMFSNVVEDRSLLTAQNPASALEFAQRLVAKVMGAAHKKQKHSMIDDASESLKNSASEMHDHVVGFAGDLAAKVMGTEDKAQKLSAMESATETLKNSAADMRDHVVGAAETLVAKMTGSDAKKPVQKAMESAAESLKNSASDMRDHVVEMRDQVVDAAQNLAAKVPDKKQMKKAMESATESLKNSASDIRDQVVDAAQNLAAKVPDKKQMKKAMESATESLKNSAADMRDHVVDAAETLVAKVTGNEKPSPMEGVAPKPSASELHDNVVELAPRE